MRSPSVSTRGSPSDHGVDGAGGDLEDGGVVGGLRPGGAGREGQPHQEGHQQEQPQEQAPEPAGQVGVAVGIGHRRRAPRQDERPVVVAVHARRRRRAGRGDRRHRRAPRGTAPSAPWTAKGHTRALDRASASSASPAGGPTSPPARTSVPSASDRPRPDQRDEGAAQPEPLPGREVRRRQRPGEDGPLLGEQGRQRGGRVQQRVHLRAVDGRRRRPHQARRTPRPAPSSSRVPTAVQLSDDGQSASALLAPTTSPGPARPRSEPLGSPGRRASSAPSTTTTTPGTAAPAASTSLASTHPQPAGLGGQLRRGRRRRAHRGDWPAARPGGAARRPADAAGAGARPPRRADGRPTRPACTRAATRSAPGRRRAGRAPRGRPATARRRGR